MGVSSRTLGAGLLDGARIRAVIPWSGSGKSVQEHGGAAGACS